MTEHAVLESLTVEPGAKEELLSSTEPVIVTVDGQVDWAGNTPGQKTEEKLLLVTLGSGSMTFGQSLRGTLVGF